MVLSVRLNVVYNGSPAMSLALLWKPLKLATSEVRKSDQNPITKLLRGARTTIDIKINGFFQIIDNICVYDHDIIIIPFPVPD